MRSYVLLNDKMLSVETSTDSFGVYIYICSMYLADAFKWLKTMTLKNENMGLSIWV